MWGESKRFYVYVSAEGQVKGPYAYDQIQRFDPETLVAVEGGREWWPRRRWRANGELTVHPWEHYNACFWVLIVMPGIAWIWWPEFLHIEPVMAWALVLFVDVVCLLSTKREYPRFPGQEMGAQGDVECIQNR